MTSDASARTRPRLHVVSGKGGTGKTTVAAALALALASGGSNVLVCEVEGRQGLASLFDVAPLPYEERQVAVGLGDGGDVCALAIDTRAAFLEYLDMFYRLGRAGKALDKFGVVDFATTVAPGVRDVLLTGKVFEATNRRVDGVHVYDAVILDAPPTGRIGRFLNVNSEVAGIAKVGPIRKQADAIMRLLRSPDALVHLVTSLEEMPVQETIDAVTELGDLRLPLGAVVINRLRTPALPQAALDDAVRGELDVGSIETSLKEAGLKSEPAVVDGLLDAGRRHGERVQLETAQRQRLDTLGLSVVALPYLSDGVDLGSLYELAADLKASGAF